MCGILGYIALNSKLIEQDKFNHALELMAHRGPDSQGVFEVDNILLGHRRLSIIDLSENANLPFHDQDENLVITYNGEIYNYIEIRTLLIRKGYHFKTQSDTEVILKSYREWGKNCLEKFNGMFAFFIYDIRKKKGFGARDRFGVKPFYFYSSDNSFIFSSEVKPLLALGVNASPNFEYIQTFITNSALDYGSGSLIKEINQLESGQLVELQNNKISIKNWWTNDNLLIELPKTYNERVELYRETLSDAVKIRLRSDVKTALTLSGGMDSTSIYSTYKNLQSKDESIKPLDIFTIKYGDSSGVDEVDAVKKITSFYGDAFNSIEVESANAFSKLYETMYFQEFPAWNISPISYHDIYKNIKTSGNKVLLEGHGNDEILGGYKNHVNLSVKYFLNDLKIKDAWMASKIFSKMNNEGIGQKYISPITSMLYNALPLVREFRENNLLESIKKLDLWDPMLNLKFQKKVSNSNFSGFQNELLLLVNTQILPTVLRVFDRATMASSIEMRAPFMDYRLTQIAFSLRDNEKIGGDYQKRILRDAMKGYLPESIRNDIVKKGFTGNLITWFNDTHNHPIIYGIINKINSNMPLNKKTVKSFFENNYANGFNWENVNILSRVLSFVVWWDLFIDGQYTQFNN